MRQSDPSTPASSQAASPLLRPHEPLPYRIEAGEAPAPVLLVCEHAGARIPEALGRLGLEERHLARHIAYDLGALALARALSRRLAAELVWQPYSRLVCDCNRRPEAPSFIVEVSEDTPIPGNRALPPAAREVRRWAVFEPFHRKVAERLQRRLERFAGRVALVSVHSFTPVFLGRRREVEVGLLYNRRPELARLVGRALRREGGLRVADNEPYVMDDASDFTVPHHAERRGLPCLEIEVRQDLLARDEDVEAVAARLAAALKPALWEVLA